MIKMFSKEGDLVYDPFSGSGTSLLAAKMLKRNFIGSEIIETYFKESEKTVYEYTSLLLNI